MFSDIMAHSESVANYAVKLATVLGKGEEEVNYIYNLGIHHDIGKYYLNYETLNKKGQLTKGEMDYIKRHALSTFKILKSNPLYSIEFAREASLHHEASDGSGYPYGLTQDLIPEKSQILRIADVFSALTEERVYKSAFSFHSACKIMISEREKYNQEMLETFLAEVVGV